MQDRMQHNNGSKNSVGGAKIHWITASMATFTLVHFHNVGGVPASFGCKRSCKHMVQQECIPIGCVPSAAVAVCWGGVSASMYAGIHPPAWAWTPWAWACRTPPQPDPPTSLPGYGPGPLCHYCNVTVTFKHVRQGTHPSAIRTTTPRFI